ncbi:RHS repeat domain-containing protein [Mucilaginibacter kameinonensis]|uniref:hypothetical protein n=1 Tax=Mucilaginibacter kameinonensis TaxID=452286 RepID=UPI000EF7E17D|nr:hypothetical protein [Mucilaginibacter kameinonensis]
MKKIIFFSILLYSIKISAQTLPTGVSIHTPELTAFNRNLETPVSLYSGVPDINIPLYTIAMNGVSVPISLNYHAGGIRVDQEATWVGLGWSLSYGGQISRVVRGLPDERSFMVSTSINDFFTSNNTSQNRAESLNSAKNGGNDYMPDIFYYSALSYSGKFLFNQQNRKFVLFPKEDISVKNFESSPNNLGVVNRFYSWNMKLPDGTSIDFGRDGTTTELMPGNYSSYATGAWLIKTIKNVFNDSITYNYQQKQYYANKFKDQSVVYNINQLTSDVNGAYAFQPDNSNDPTARLTQYGYYDSQLSSINFPGGTINFTTGTRDDLPAGSMGPLTAIQVIDNQGKVVKNIRLSYDYFYGDANDILVQQWGATGAAQMIPDAQRYKRLKLTSVAVLDSDGSVVQNYKFDYYTASTMPSKLSTSQDHYGFYNGIANDGAYYGLIPKFIPTFPQTFKGGDRRINPNVSNAFTLKSITYPEGGKTELVYENNTAKAAGLPKGLLNYYQDDNIVNKSIEINLNGNTRLQSNLNTDSISPTGTRYYYKYFTIKNAGFLFDGYGWNCSTNFGAAANEQQLTAANDNAICALETFNGTQWVTIQQYNSHPSDGVFTLSNNDFLKLGSGVNLGPNYRLKVMLTYTGTFQAAQLNQPYTLNFKINYREIDTTKMMINVGGLRVKDINSYLADGTLATVKHYDYVDPTQATIPNLTSGRTVSLPNYRQIRYQRYGGVKGTSGSQTSTITNKYSILLGSQSSQPLETTLGSYAGYEYVTESLVDINNSQNNLKTISHFSFGDPSFSQYYAFLYQGIYEATDWTRGKLLSRQIYKGSNVLKSENYTYYEKSPHLGDFGVEDAVDEVNTNLVSSQYLQYPRNTAVTNNIAPDFVDYNSDYISNGLFPWDSNNLQPPCDLVWYYGVDDYTSPNYNYMGPPYRQPCGSHPYTQVPHFYHYTGFDKLKSLTTTLYDGGTGVTETENYLYEKTPNLYQKTTTQRFNSSNDILLTTYKYPVDSSSANAYNHMLLRHILSPVIEQSEFKNSSFLELKGSNYQQWADTAVVLPVRQMVKVGSGTAYAATVFDAYDSKGNFLTLSRSNGVKLSYHWGYNNLYPIAEIKNATSAEFYYEGFEESMVTNVIIGTGHTGRRFYNGSYTVNWTRPNSRNYVISYWYYSNGLWLLKDAVPYSGSSYALTGGSAYDDIRIYPADAQMNSYTYDPLIGMTSVTDAKNLTSYYEYDGLLRLKNIKDKDGNIVKHFDYHYQGQ